jgi:nicotinamide mononucleotide adenylyltransferase
MSNYIARTEVESSSSKEKYSMFVGRWQPWHAGHQWLIDQRLNEGKKVLLCIREVEPDEKNPWTAQQIYNKLLIELKDLIIAEKLRIITIPDIESINYGRGVGYDIIEHVPPTEVGDISATKIREQMKKDGKL